MAGPNPLEYRRANKWSTAAVSKIPEAVLAKLQDLAASENVSVDEFAAATLSQRAAAAFQLEYLAQRAASGSREKFLRVMSKVPNVPPIPPDEAPPE